MDQARELLLNGKNVSEVAYVTGYKYIPNFTKAFKKYFGVAPTRLKGWELFENPVTEGEPYQAFHQEKKESPEAELFYPADDFFFAGCVGGVHV